MQETLLWGVQPRMSSANQSRLLNGWPWVSLNQKDITAACQCCCLFTALLCACQVKPAENASHISQ